MKPKRVSYPQRRRIDRVREHVVRALAGRALTEELLAEICAASPAAFGSRLTPSEVQAAAFVADARARKSARGAKNSRSEAAANRAPSLSSGPGTHSPGPH